MCYAMVCILLWSCCDVLLFTTINFEYYFDSVGIRTQTLPHGNPVSMLGDSDIPSGAHTPSDVHSQGPTTPPLLPLCCQQTARGAVQSVGTAQVMGSHYTERTPHGITGAPRVMSALLRVCGEVCVG